MQSANMSALDMTELISVLEKRRKKLERKIKRLKNKDLQEKRSLRAYLLLTRCIHLVITRGEIAYSEENGEEVFGLIKYRYGDLSMELNIFSYLSACLNRFAVNLGEGRVLECMWFYSCSEAFIFYVPGEWEKRIPRICMKKQPKTDK